MAMSKQFAYSALSDESQYSWSSSVKSTQSGPCCCQCPFHRLLFLMNLNIPVYIHFSAKVIIREVKSGPFYRLCHTLVEELPYDLCTYGYAPK